jgi:phage gp36-like protein
MPLCTLDDLKDYLHAGYLESFEEQNPGLAQRTIAAVSGEVTDLLRRRYPLPWPEVPALVRYIVAAISAYRTAEAITSVVDTEGDTENEWIPLQAEWKRATEMLEKLSTGKLKLPLATADDADDYEDPTVAVVTGKPLFDFEGF